MNKLKSIWKLAVYLKEWMKLCLHYLRIWEVGVSPTASREDKLAIMTRMRTGVLRYECERAEMIKLEAINLWFGTKLTSVPDPKIPK